MKKKEKKQYNKINVYFKIHFTFLIQTVHLQDTRSAHALYNLNQSYTKNGYFFKCIETCPLLSLKHNNNFNLVIYLYFLIQTLHSHNTPSFHNLNPTYPKKFPTSSSVPKIPLLSLIHNQTLTF